MNTATRQPESSFQAELKLLPPAAWWTAGVVLLFFLLVGWTILGVASMHRGASGPPAFVFLLLGIGPLLPGVLFSLWTLLVFYVYADAGTRRMNRPLWTLLAIFVPYMIGFIIYFIVRDPRPRPCPACGAPIVGMYNFCSSCGKNLARVCPSCHQAIEEFWSNCAHCGKPLREGTSEVQPG